MTKPGAASEYNKLFPEKGQRVQRHKRGYSTTGPAPQPAQGWDEEQGGGQMLKPPSAARLAEAGRAPPPPPHKAGAAADPALAPVSPPRTTQATGLGLSTVPLSAPSRQRAGPGPLAKRANTMFS